MSEVVRCSWMRVPPAAEAMGCAAPCWAQPHSGHCVHTAGRTRQLTIVYHTNLYEKLRPATTWLPFDVAHLKRSSSSARKEDAAPPCCCMLRRGDCTPLLVSTSPGPTPGALTPWRLDVRLADLGGPKSAPWSAACGLGTTFLFGFCRLGRLGVEMYCGAGMVCPRTLVLLELRAAAIAAAIACWPAAGNSSEADMVRQTCAPCTGDHACAALISRLSVGAAYLQWLLTVLHHAVQPWVLHAKCEVLVLGQAPMT